MGEPQIIRAPNGDELVVLSRADYDALRAVFDEAVEDGVDSVVGRAALEEWIATGRGIAPPDVSKAVMAGSSILEAYRKHRGLATSDLAARSGVAAAAIERLEKRQGDLPRADLDRIARALGIAPDLLTVAL